MPTQLDFHEIPADEVESTRDGMRVLRAKTLGDWISELGGWEGQYKHPVTGASFPASLRQWEGRDPDTTWIAVGFITEPAWDILDTPEMNLPDEARQQLETLKKEAEPDR